MRGIVSKQEVLSDVHRCENSISFVFQINISDFPNKKHFISLINANKTYNLFCLRILLNDSGLR